MVPMTKRMLLLGPEGFIRGVLEMQMLVHQSTFFPEINILTNNYMDWHKILCKHLCGSQRIHLMTIVIPQSSAQSVYLSNTLFND